MVLSEYLDLDENNFAKPELESFKAAYKGYYKLKEEGKIKKDLLTIIDFTKSSTERRMWVIDMNNQEVLYQTVVSHGRKSGMEYASDFSNVPESRSEEHTSESSHVRISYAVFCLKKKTTSATH